MWWNRTFRFALLLLVVTIDFRETPISVRRLNFFLPVMTNLAAYISPESKKNIGQNNSIFTSTLLLALVTAEWNSVLLTLSPPIPLRLYTLPYWSNPPFLIFDILDALATRTERQYSQISKIKNNGFDQYRPEPFEQQQFGIADVEGVKRSV